MDVTKESKLFSRYELHKFGHIVVCLPRGPVSLKMRRNAADCFIDYLC